jgi:predicted transcriptional regulator
MELNRTGQEYNTYYIRLFREFHPELQLLSGSALGIKILFLLKSGARNPFTLSEATGSSMPALLAEINTLIREGLIERVRNEYVLTNSAGIIAPQLIEFITAAGMLNRERNGEDAEPVQVDESISIDALMDILTTIQTLCRSWIVAGSLFALSNGTKTRSELCDVADCTATAFIPRIRWLEAMGLVREERCKYTLTPEGTAVAAEMERVTATFAAVMRHRDFWNSHSIDHLPEFAIHAFGDLADAEIIRDNPTNYLLNYEHYLSLLAKAAYVHGFSAMANPSISDAIGARAMAGIPIELIVSPELAYQLYQKPYREKVALLSTVKHLQFRVTDLPIPMGLTVTDRCISAKLFGRDGVYDMQNGLFCTSPEAREWGERLFAYYKEHSVPMEEHARSAGWIPEDR